MVKKLLESFFDTKLHKMNHIEFRIEKVIRERGVKLCKVETI